MAHDTQVRGTTAVPLTCRCGQDLDLCEQTHACCPRCGAWIVTRPRRRRV